MLAVLIFFSQCQSDAKKEEKGDNSSSESRRENHQNDTIVKLYMPKLVSTGRYHFIEEFEGFSDIYGLELIFAKGTYTINFFGPSPEGEHGMYFFKSDVKEFEQIDSLSFKAILVKGLLYPDSITFESLGGLDTLKSAGFDNTELKLRGQFISGDSLIIDCVAQNEYDCFGTGKLFTKR